MPVAAAPRPEWWGLPTCARTRHKRSQPRLTGSHCTVRLGHSRACVMTRSERQGHTQGVSGERAGWRAWPLHVQGRRRAGCAAGALTVQERRVLLPDLVLLVNEPLLHLVRVLIVPVAHLAWRPARRQITAAGAAHSPKQGVLTRQNQGRDTNPHPVRAPGVPGVAETNSRGPASAKRAAASLSPTSRM